MGARLTLELMQKRQNLYNARTDFNKLLKDMKPNQQQGERMRDTICHGIEKILKLSQSVSKEHPSLDFHILHIILTNGLDTHSKFNLNQLGQMMNFLNSKVDKQAVSHHFIGVNPTWENQDEVLKLSKLSEDTSSCSFIFTFHKPSIQDTFDKIQATIETQQSQSVSKKYIVVFTLDIGYSWHAIRYALSNFMLAFKEKDHFSFISFKEGKFIEMRPTYDQMFKGDRSKSFEKLKIQRKKELQKMIEYEEELYKKWAQPQKSGCAIF